MQKFLTGVLLAVMQLGGAEFERGGVTFPMERISAERFQSVTDKETNLLKNPDFTQEPVPWGKMDTGWSAGHWIFGKENRERFDKSAAQIATAVFADTESGRVMDLNRPAGLETLMGAASPMFTLAFSQVVRLAENDCGPLCISFESRNLLRGKNRSDQMLLIFFYDDSSRYPGQGKETGPYLCRKLNPASEWQASRYEFPIPAGTRKIKLSFRGDGCGRLQIRNVHLAKAAQDMPVTIERAPGDLLDHTFALASGAPGILAFRMKNNLPKGKLEAESMTLHLELPAEVSVIGSNRMLGAEIKSREIQKNGKNWKEWTTSLAPSILSHLRSSQNFTGWYLPSVMLFSSAAGKTKWDECRFFLSANGKQVSNRGIFTLRMIAPFEKTIPPKQFYCGFHSVNSDIDFHQAEAQKLLSEFFARTGNTLIVSKLLPEYLKMLRESGIRLITSESYFFANAYRIGVVERARKPAYSNYLDRDGKTVSPRRDILWSCPVSIYNRTPYYTDLVLPQLRNSLAGLDGLQPNWEPYLSRGKGCFCDNCRAEFAKFAKLSPEKAKEIWPHQLFAGKPYYAQGVRFRAWQHGRMIQTLHEDAVKFGAAGIGFCPEVGIDQIIRYPDYFKEQGEFTPYAYAGSLKWLNVWGPYAWFLADQPYSYSRVRHLYVWETAKRVIRDYRASFPDPAKRAKLMAMPHGSQLNVTALGQPEGMAMDQISSFLAGFDASVLYFFPRGYDHRFWKALASSSALIAANEEMVLTGRRRTDLSVTPRSPFSTPGRFDIVDPLANINPKYMPDLRESALLQAAAFEKNGCILAAVGNFWEKGDVVFSLRIPKLEPDREYTVLEKAFRRQFVPEKGKCFTGKMLEEGILLHAGALRWHFFEIAPAVKTEAESVTAGAVRSLLEQCRKENRAAAEMEKSLDRAFQMENEIGELKEMKHGALSCKVVGKGAAAMLEVVSGKNKLLLNPRGMALESWSINGGDLCSAGFGLSAFWSPGKGGMTADGAYRVTDQALSADGLRVTAELTTTQRTYPWLPGLKIVRTVTISPDLGKVVFESVLHNTTSQAMKDVGYRWSFQPVAWSRNSGGSAEHGGRNIPRPENNTLFTGKNCTAYAEQRIGRLFQVKQVLRNLKGNEFKFLLPRGRNLHASFLPARLFAGTAVWTLASASTFEPCYLPVTIAPGGQAVFTAAYSLE